MFYKNSNVKMFLNTAVEPYQGYEEKVERGWQEARRKATLLGRELYAGDLLRVVEVRDLDNEVQILLEPSVTYRDVVGLRTGPRDWYMNISEDLLPMTLSIFCLVLTTDGKLVWGWRDSGDFAAGHEIPGGFIYPTEKLSYNSISKRIFLDDFKLEAEQTEPEVLGVLRNKDILEYHVMTLTRLNMSSKQFEAHCKSKLPRWTRLKNLVDFKNKEEGLHRGGVYFSEFPQVLDTDSGTFHPPSLAILRAVVEAYNNFNETEIRAVA